MITTSKNEFLAKMKLYLTPPGEGVYTVHTAAQKRQLLQKRIYGEGNIKALWESSLDQKLIAAKTVLLGIPSDCGGGIQRGANWGPLFLRETLLSSKEDIPSFDIGDVRVIPHLLDDKYLNIETIKNCRLSLYENEKLSLPVSPLSIAYDFAKDFHHHFPSKTLFTIGGDHSVSYPMVRAYLEAKKIQKKKVAVIHFDAHTDLLESRLGIDLCFGTWAAHIIPFLESPECLIQIGIRSSAKDKHFWENKFGISQIWTKEVLDIGAEKTAELIINKLLKLNIDEIYISFDIDCIDEKYAGATGTPEPEGLTPHEPMVIMQKLFENFKITGSDMMEIAPQVKPSHIKQVEPETTLMVASSLSTFLIQAMHGHS